MFICCIKKFACKLMKMKLNVFLHFLCLISNSKKKIDPKVVTNINLCFEQLRLRDAFQKKGPYVITPPPIKSRDKSINRNRTFFRFYTTSPFKSREIDLTSVDCLRSMIFGSKCFQNKSII